MHKGLKNLSSIFLTSIFLLNPLKSYSQIEKNEEEREIELTKEGQIEKIVHRNQGYEEKKRFSEIKNKKPQDYIGGTFNFLAEDEDWFEHPYRKLPDSDNIPFMQNFVDRVQRIIETDYPYYSYVLKNPNKNNYQENLERMLYDEEYGIDVPRVLLNSLGEVFEGFDVVQETKKKIKDTTSVETKIDKTRFKLSIRYNDKHNFRPNIEIKHLWGVDKIKTYYIGEEYFVEINQKITPKSYCGMKIQKDKEEKEISVFYSAVF